MFYYLKEWTDANENNKDILEWSDEAQFYSDGCSTYEKSNRLLMGCGWESVDCLID